MYDYLRMFKGKLWLHQVSLFGVLGVLVLWSVFNKTFIFDAAVISGIIIMIILGTFLFSLYQTSWADIGDSARRMSMVLVPILIFSSARLFNIINTKI